MYLTVNLYSICFSLTFKSESSFDTIKTLSFTTFCYSAARRWGKPWDLWRFGHPTEWSHHCCGNISRGTRSHGQSGRTKLTDTSRGRNHEHPKSKRTSNLRKEKDIERRRTSNPGSSISVRYSLNSLLKSGKYRKQTEFFMPELLACTKRDTMSSQK